jgi:glycyl-tRNA synthetase
MKNAYNLNGLIQWDESQLEFRDHISKLIPIKVRSILEKENRGWIMKRVETPVLIPSGMINPNYTADDVWNVENPYTKDIRLPTPIAMTLRPETTPGTYIALQNMLNHNEVIPPICVWQVGKSFRREHDQPTKFMRLKEFNQLEFQCLYAEGTMNDYQYAVRQPLADMVNTMLNRPVRIVNSDRLPSYSKKTIDIEVNVDPKTDRWMEVCSISLRTDFPDKLHFSTKNGPITKDAFVLEIAFGIDRLVYIHTANETDI